MDPKLFTIQRGGVPLFNHTFCQHLPAFFVFHNLLPPILIAINLFHNQIFFLASHTIILTDIHRLDNMLVDVLESIYPIGPA